MKYIQVSKDAVEQFTAWFPDCGGIVNVDDAWDALNGYNISTGEICDLIMKLQSDDVEEFMPFCKMELRDHVSDLLAELHGIGLGESDEDEDGFPIEVNGADCVDVVSQYITKLGSAVARDKKAATTELGRFFDIEPEDCENTTFAVWWEDDGAPGTWGTLYDFLFDNLPRRSKLDFVNFHRLFQQKALASDNEVIEDVDLGVILNELCKFGWSVYDSGARTLFWAPGTAPEPSEDEDE